MCGYVQCRRTSRRRQRSSVPGVTSRLTRAGPERRRAKAASTARSAHSSPGSGSCLRSTATSRRSTSSSASLAAENRAINANQPVKRTNITQSIRTSTGTQCCQRQDQHRRRTRRSAAYPSF
jgi:hypothetical protein